MDSVFVNILDNLGTFAFAMSGTLTALHRRFDYFGALVIAFVTATGGGTLRDLLTDAGPVFWTEATHYFYYIFAGYLIAVLFQSSLHRLSNTMFLFDTIGISIFTIIGMEKTLNLGFSPLIALNMGVMSAVVGGVIRDVLTHVPPLIFRREIYAIPCYIGGMVYWMMGWASIPLELNILVTIILIILIRLIAIKRHWSISPHKDLDDDAV